MQDTMFNTTKNNAINFRGGRTVHQSRTFGSHPFLSWLLLDLLAKAIAAKFSPFYPISLPYNPTPWLPYSKPYAPWSNTETYPPSYPIYKPPLSQPTYSNSYQSYPTLTTSAPPYYQTKSTSYPSYDYNYPPPKSDESQSIKSDFYQDLIPAASNTNHRRLSPNYNRKKSNNRDRYSQQKRRRTTTPAYYDSYEDYDSRPNRRRRPYYEKDSSESYEEYDLPETTKRTPFRNKNKKRRGEVKTEDPSYVDFDDRVPPAQTEIVIVRQAATTTEAVTTTVSAATTTGSTNGTTVATTTTGTTTGTTTSAGPYGYGPSNGNEGVSITYGPPGGQFGQYGAPYIDWYNNPRNSVVKRIRDIVGIQHKLNLP